MQTEGSQLNSFYGDYWNVFGDTDRVKAADIQAARSEIKDFLFRGR